MTYFLAHFCMKRHEKACLKVKRVAFESIIFLYGRIMFLSQVLHVKFYVEIP